MQSRVIVPLVVTCALMAAGCSSYTLHRQAEAAEQSEAWDEAVLHYLSLVEEEPGNISYRAALMRAKAKASQYHFDKGKRFHEAGSLERALVEYRQAVELDTTNQYAFVQLGKVREELEARRLNLGEARTIEEMKREARERSQPPLLHPRSKEPISLDFPEPVSIKEIYQAMGKAYGINILFDPNLKDQSIAIELLDVNAQDALEILMRAAQHFYKVLDEHTVLIAADTPQNRRAYEDLVIQTFFLSNAEVKDVMTMLRTLVDAKKIASNEQLNAIIVRDSADRVKVAERIIQANDKAKAEVVIDVELLLVSSQMMQDLGFSLSDYNVTQALDFGENEPVRFSDLANLTQNAWVLNIPSFIYTFVKNNADAQVLAKPQLRITEGEKATLHIGERVPIPTTTFNTANTVGGNIVPITSFQYTDIGIKINIEPRVHHNLEITLVLKVEISNIAGSVTGSGGQEQPIIGTRNIETTIRLKDGETNFLAGLLRTDETSSDTEMPGLSDIPVLGRLFTRSQRNNQLTDVILTTTPHIIRKSDITEEDLLPIWVGTEQNMSFREGSPRVESAVEGPFDEGTSSAERVRELIRQRVRELPRGLQQQSGEGGGPGRRGGGERPEDDEGAGPREEEELPQGFELVPGSGPSDIFSTPEPEPETPPDEPDGDLQSRLPDAPPALAGPPSSIRFAADEKGRAVKLRVVPALPVAEPGERFEVRLEVKSDRPVAHLPLVLAYDPAVLRVVSWRDGGFLGDDVEILAAESEPGRLVIGASRLGARPGVTGHGTLATLTVEAVGQGWSALELVDPRALDAGLEAIRPVRSESADILVLPGLGKPSAGDVPKES